MADLVLQHPIRHHLVRHHLVLYDGVCGLCHRLTQFILKRDARDRFRFSSLQNSLAEELLARHGLNPRDLNTVYVVANFSANLSGSGEQLLSRARAVVFVLKALGGVWGLVRLFELFPWNWLDAAYDFVAVRRYGWFGRAEACLLPRADQRLKFMDVPSEPSRTR